MKKFMFYLEGIQTWINLMNIETVYQSNGWKVVMRSGKELPISDTEYWKLTDEFRKEPERPREDR
ncbi:MAG: hypothetical protein KBT34_10370 [Prevotella sp.]|nr:hypothetical protein [Candidatus Prevotella equi]